jgi:iron complex outermembrane receptor protein
MEIPSNAHVITDQDIRERGYNTLESILADVPGFQFRNIQSMNSYVFTRGIPNQNNLTLVLIDGIQVNELNSGGFYGGGQFNLDNITRIEIIYAPSSVAYSTNAVSGIINIITKSALKSEVRANMSYGSFNTGRTDFSWARANKEKGYGLRLSAMYKTTDKTPLGGAVGDHNWSEDMENFERNGAGDIKFESRQWTVGTNYSHKQSSRTAIYKSQNTPYRDAGSFWNIIFLNNYVRYKRILSKNSEMWAMAYHRNTTVMRNSIYTTTDTAQTGAYRPGNLTGSEAVFKFQPHTKLAVTGGILFEYARLSEAYSFTQSRTGDAKPPLPGTPPTAEQYLGGLFIEPKITLWSHVFLTTAARYDYSSVYKHVFTPRLGINYVIKKQLFKLSYAEGFRGPRPWDLSYGLGNNDLNPEHIKSVEASAILHLKKSWSADIRLYKNELDNLLTLENTSKGSRWTNYGEVQTDGTELYVKYRRKHLQMYGGYTFTDTYNENGSRLKEISNHMAQAGFSLVIKKYFNLHLRSQFTGPRENPKIITATKSNMISPFVIFHGTLSVINYRGFTLQLTVENILDTEYYHPSHLMPERYRQAQRSFVVNLGYQISALN